VRARLLVAADGLHSRIRREAGLEAEGGSGRFGVRRHFARAPWSRFVEVHWSDDAEAYVTPVGPDLVGVALLWHGKNEHFDSLLSRFPALREKLDGVDYASRAAGAGPFRQRVTSRLADDLALVGDAAGYLDPLTGEGMTLGFRSARALVDTVAAGRPLADYERAYRELSRNYYRMTGMLLRIAERPRLRRRVVRMLARRPDVFSTMLAVNAGDAPVTALGVGGALGMVGGLLRG
jgi:flavin-dependent dehydrogenase